MKSVKHLCMIMVFLCALPIAALAQAGGSIDGTVTDPNGAVVAGAKVTATNTATGVKATLDTTPAGLYAFPLLPVGPYTISVTQAGFKTFLREGITVEVGLSETINVKLELGTVQQTVEVKAEADVLETNNATRGVNISSQTMDMLPFFSGGAMRLGNAFISYTPGYNGNGETSINGSTGRASEVMVDGGSLISPESGGTSFYFPGYEAYGEFKIITSGFLAENGYVGGGIQEFVTKSGTNDLHGSAFFNFERQIFNAVAYTTNATQNQNVINAPCVAVQAKACRPFVRYNDEGGSAGGPISLPHIYDGRNKSFFFFTYEGYWQPAAVTTNTGESMPTAAMLQGNFAGLAPIYDPATTVAGVRTQFPSNAIPTSRFSAISKNIVNYLTSCPLCAPNSGTSASPTGNYQFNSTSALRDWDWSIKIDHTIRTNHHLAFFYTHRLNDTNSVQYYPGPLSNGQDSTFQPHQFRGSWDWVVNPHMVMHSFVSTSNDNTLQHSPLQHGYGCSWGFNGDMCGSNQDNSPVIVFQTDLTTAFAAGNATNTGPCSTCTTWGQYQSAVNNKGQTNHIYMGGQTLSDIRGKNEFKMGWEIRRFATYNTDWSGSNGQYLFNAAQTASQTTTVSTTGESFASFLLGDVNLAGASGLPALMANIRYAYSAGFFEDTWRVRPKLTVNLGIRYEVPIGWHYATDALGTTYSAFSETAVNPQAGNLPGAMIFPGSGPGHTGSLRPYPTDFSNIGPRAGFAYQLNNKTVIRASWGIFYERVGNGGCGCTDGYGGGSWTQSGDNFDPVIQWDATSSQTAGTHPPATFVPASQYPGVDNFGGGTPYYMGPKFAVAPRIYDGNFTVQRQYKNWLFEAGYVTNRTHGASSTLFLNAVPDTNLSLMSTPAGFSRNGIVVPTGTNLLSYTFATDTPAHATQSAYLNSLGYYAPSGAGSLNNLVGAGWSTPWTTGWGPGGATLAQSLRPFPQMGTVYSGNSGDGWLAYDALQVKIEHRFGDLNLESFWTWSKTLDMMTYRQIFTQSGGTVPQTEDANNIPLSKTFSNSDIPQTVGFTMSYNLPFGRGKKFLGNSNGVLNKFVGGWNVAGVGHYASGLLIATNGGVANNLGSYLFEAMTNATNTGVPVKTNIGANQLQYLGGPDGNPGQRNGTNRWFTTSTAAGSITATNPSGINGSASYISNVPGTLGNVSLYNNNFRQPWGRYENMSINKTVWIYGEGKVYLRYSLNMFNPFNRAPLGGINGTVNSTGFGEATGTNTGIAARSMSMGLRLYF